MNEKIEQFKELKSHEKQSNMFGINGYIPKIIYNYQLSTKLTFIFWSVHFET